jgi:hypothetical protein
VKRTRNLNQTRKVRARKLPRNDKLIREWEGNGWEYSLYQRPSGSYMLLAYEIDGDNWRIESGDTIKACLAAAQATDADVESLLLVPEE